MERKGASVSRQLVWGGLVVATLIGMMAAGLWIWQPGRFRQGASEERPLEGLRAFGAVPAFSLLERNRRRIDLRDLIGKVWITNFFYTHCPDTCPIQSAQMRELQAEFKNERELRLVSITVDPERDTAEVLSSYADRFGADPEVWFFLTGEAQAIHRLAQEGFRLGAAEIPHEKREASGATHTHSPRFVLIDRKAEIRGYYAGTDGEAMARLRRDVRILLRGAR